MDSILKWSYIKNNCPKAYSEYTVKENLFTGDLHRVCRKLYTFFDDRELYVGVSKRGHKWSGSLTSGLNMISFRPRSFDARLDAEEAMFKEAFEILEQRL